MHGICHFKTQINSLKITQAKGEIGKGKLICAEFSTMP